MTPRTLLGLSETSLAEAWIVAIAILTLASCAQTKEYPPGSVIEGVMHRSEIEGGCWIFVADDGQKYELVGAQVVGLQKQGVRAKLAMKPRPDLASICMVGKIVEVVEVIKTYSQVDEK